MKVRDMVKGKFYRVIESHDIIRPGSILLCTEHDFVIDLPGATEGHRLWAVAVHVPGHPDMAGFTLYKDWENGIRVEEVNFQFDGVTEPEAPASPQPHVRPHSVDALAQLAQSARHYVGPWSCSPEFTRHVQRMAKQARNHPQGDALAPIMLAYYRGETVQWRRSGDWHDAKRYAPVSRPLYGRVEESYTHGIQWSHRSTYRIKPRGADHEL